KRTKEAQVSSSRQVLSKSRNGGGHEKKSCASCLWASGCGCRANDGSDHEVQTGGFRGVEQLQSRTPERRVRIFIRRVFPHRNASCLHSIGSRGHDHVPARRHSQARLQRQLRWSAFLGERFGELLAECRLHV